MSNSPCAPAWIWTTGLFAVCIVPRTLRSCGVSSGSSGFYPEHIAAAVASLTLTQGTWQQLQPPPGALYQSRSCCCHCCHCVPYATAAAIQIAQLQCGACAKASSQRDWAMVVQIESDWSFVSPRSPSCHQLP